MQDHEIPVEDFKNELTLQNLASLPLRKNEESSENEDSEMNAATSEGNRVERNENFIELPLNDASLSKEQNLPEMISSNYKNSPPHSDKKDYNNSMQNHVDKNAKENNDMGGSEENVVENLIDIIPDQSPMSTGEPRLNDDEDSHPLMGSNFNLYENSVSLIDSQNILKLNSETFDKTTENVCAVEHVRNDDKNEKEKILTLQTLKQRKEHSEKPPTLAEDSKLVKISLPTSSMNIMQSNAQFLNKSRNFLNFLTEKSTNIMEKTLLPQNLAGRYNSILKMTEAIPIEKKSIQESSYVPSAHPGYNTQPEKSVESPSLSENPPVDLATLNEEKEILPETKTEKNLTDVATVSEPPMNEHFLTKSNESRILTNEFTYNLDKSQESNNVDSIKWENNSEEPLQINSTPDENFSDASWPIEASDTLLKHPVYLTLVRDYAKVRDEKLKLADRVEHLEGRMRILESQNSSELFNVQLEALEKTVERLTSELNSANASKEELSREYAAANKERESMVMKYAVSEKQLIDTQRAREYAERRYKEVARDHELLQNKLRQSQNEKSRICHILDTKCRELTDSQKEVEKLKEEVNVRDVKLKWTQTKLKTEMESQKETQAKLDKATTRINDMKEECEQIRRESQEMIRQFQHSEENKAVTLDHQLKEQQARLILERHVTEDKEMLRLQLQKEVDQLKNRQLALIEENNTLSLKIQDLEKNRLAYEGKLSELKNVADQRQKEIVDLLSKVSHLETLKLQLIHKEQCLMSNEAEVERLRQVNQELQADMDCCRQREAHMLDFTQKLTDKNVRLQSEFTAIEAKATQLEQEQGPLRESIAEFKTRIKTLEESLNYEKNKRTEDCEILARHLAEQTQIAQNLAQKLEESQGEIAVLKRKQQISVKEMSRELQQCRKKLETYESASPSNSLDPTSRAGSNNSLNAGDSLNGATSDNSGNGDVTRQTAELDRQALIDRILKMQKINVRRAEKLDFLEEHTRTLVAELQKKTKIIQNYILHENFDAMGSNERDRHKAELARYGGIMASVYSQRVSDDNMTLELSLEINQKLQAVLEDALLKNITLKDNIDTLGEEIARLTIKNQQLLQQAGK